jgi:hypothetical protein
LASELSSAELLQVELIANNCGGTPRTSRELKIDCPASTQGWTLSSILKRRCYALDAT